MNFWKIVQSEAHKNDSVFFLDCGDGNEMTTEDFNAEDLFGWLVPNSKASEFEKLFIRNDDSTINDRFSEFYKSATWSLSDKTISVKFA